MPMTRTFSGVRFVCQRPGVWISECGRFGVYLVMAGTMHEQWELYRGNHGEDPMVGELLGVNFTLGEVMRDFKSSI